MGAAVGGVLAVDEGPVGLAVAADVGEGELEVPAGVMGGLVGDSLVGGADLALQQVEEPLLRGEGAAVEDQAEPAVEAGVVPQPALDELDVVLVAVEDPGVGPELHQRAVGLAGGRSPLRLLLQLSRFEERLGVLPGPVRDHPEAAREGVHRLGADAVEAHRELVDVVVVLGPGVDHRDTLHQLAQGNAGAVVANADPAALDLDLHLAAVAHHELVHGVVDHLLEQHVDAVVGIGAVAEAANVHPRPQADVLEGRERLDLALVVAVGAVGGGLALGGGEEVGLRRRHRAPSSSCLSAGGGAPAAHGGSSCGGPAGARAAAEPGGGPGVRRGQGRPWGPVLRGRGECCLAGGECRCCGRYGAGGTSARGGRRRGLRGGARGGAAARGAPGGAPMDPGAGRVHGPAGARLRRGPGPR